MTKKTPFLPFLERLVDRQDLALLGKTLEGLNEKEMRDLGRRLEIGLEIVRQHLAVRRFEGPRI